MSFNVNIDEQGVAVVEVSLTITTSSAEYGPMMKKIRDAASEHGVPAAGDYITVVTVPDDEPDDLDRPESLEEAVDRWPADEPLDDEPDDLEVYEAMMNPEKRNHE